MLAVFAVACEAESRLVAVEETPTGAPGPVLIGDGKPSQTYALMVEDAIVDPIAEFAKKGPSGVQSTPVVQKAAAQVGGIENQASKAGRLSRFTRRMGSFGAKFASATPRVALAMVPGAFVDHITKSFVTDLTGSKDLGAIAGYVASVPAGAAADSIVFGTPFRSALSQGSRGALLALPVVVLDHIVREHINAPLAGAIEQGDVHAAETLLAVYDENIILRPLAWMADSAFVRWYSQYLGY